MRRWSTALFAVTAVWLIAPAQPASAQSAAPYNWTGFYAGGNVGWGWSKADTTAAVPASTFIVFAVIPPLAVVDTTHPKGVIGGVQFGYDWQVASNWIAGFEADIQGSSQSAAGNHISATNSFSGVGPGAGNTFIGSSTVSHTESVDWFGTARGRLGYAIWPGMMVYGTGGLAYGRVSTSAVATQTGVTCAAVGCQFPATATANGEGSAVKTGWTAGGGIAGIVPNNAHLTWKIEYLHVDLGSINFSFAPPSLSGLVFPAGGVASVTSRFTDNIVRVGADYHF
jgi:outer membrane immunogenic protein